MKNKLLTLTSMALFAVSGAVSAVPINWTDWTSITNTSASGVMDGINVSVTSNLMDGVSQTGCGTNYWTEPNPSNPAYTGGTIDNAPTACEQVGLNSATTVNVAFDSAIDDLYIALVSVGQPSVTVTYDFDTSFTVDSDGIGYWSFANSGNPGPYTLGVGDTISMNEVHAALLFDGPVTSLSFTTSPQENWHAFTFGSAADVPEPSIIALFALGLVGIGFARRRQS